MENITWPEWLPKSERNGLENGGDIIKENPL
jgi:hypothetical protein